MRLAAMFIAVSAVAALMQSGPTFDVGSIKRNTAGPGPTAYPPPSPRPDGGFTIRNQPVTSYIARAYPGMETIGLPDWARTEHYDISTTSTLTTATNEDRIAMLRAMLADRFLLKVHIEQREEPAYDLVLARRDGRLGSGLTPSDIDCSNPTPPGPASPAPPDLTKPGPPCTLRILDQMRRLARGDRNPPPGNLMEGTTSMNGLAQGLSLASRRLVVDKTGLTGSYTIALNLDMFGAMRPPNADPTVDNGPSVFTAVQEQLGLKLEPSKATRDVLVIDRLEHPTAN